MSNLQSGANKAQMIELLSALKIPVIGNGGGSAFLGQYAWSPDYVTSAPSGWLICDGSTHLIADYPEYCALLASQHGAVNYYGGDGITTFATIDLRGEFIRGAGTNSHANQGDGANVGVHQDATEHKNSFTDASHIYYANYDQMNSNMDNVLPSSSPNYIGVSGSGGTSSESFGVYTSRPTNTSGTFFVRATVVGDPNAHHYSTEEQVVGMTEDGEAIYEKTKKGLSVSVTTTDSWQEIDTITGSKALHSVTLYSDGGNDTFVIVTPREVMINNSQKLFIKGVIGSNRTISRYTVQYTKTTS